MSKLVITLMSALIALPLAGCLADQKAAVAKCELDAMRTYPGKEPTLSNEMGHFIL
jgi:hypothetical protein